MSKTRLQVRDLSALKPVPATIADNTVIVEAGTYIKSTGVGIVTFATTTSSVFAPLTSGTKRIDVLAIDDAGSLSITSGVNGSPGVAPDYPANKLPIAEVTITEAGTVLITAADIKDVRPFLNLSGSGIGATLTVGSAIIGNLTVTATATINYLYVNSGIQASTISISTTATINYLYANGSNLGVADPLTLKKLYVPIPITNSAATGIFSTFTVSVTMTFGQVAYMLSTGALGIASAVTTVSVPVIAMCADGTVSINTVGNFLTYGIARYASWNWAVGSPIYTSTVTATQGMTQTISSVSGNVVQILGIAKSATSILFSPNLATVVIV